MLMRYAEKKKREKVKEQHCPNILCLSCILHISVVIFVILFTLKKEQVANPIEMYLQLSLVVLMEIVCLCLLLSNRKHLKRL